MLDEGNSSHSLKDAEDSLMQAHEIDANNLDIVEDLAHFYDAMKDDRIMAVKYSRMWLAMVEKRSREIRAILEDVPHDHVPDL